MEQLGARGQTSEARIAHWRSLGWDHLRAMMEPSGSEERPEADLVEAQPTPVRVGAPFTVARVATLPAPSM